MGNGIATGKIQGWGNGDRRTRRSSGGVVGGDEQKWEEEDGVRR